MILPADPGSISRAGDLIRAGELVAFPTETVYGLGADATNARAAARIFAVKERPFFDPLIVHIESAAALCEVAVEVPEAAARLVERHWPGPLTIVLRKTDAIPDIVTAGLPTVAVRVPDHPVAQALIRAARRPIAAPSANRFGCVSPTTARHVAEQLDAGAAIILDGGPCRVGVESTIISFVGDEPALLRPGGLPLEDVESIVGPVRLARPEERSQAPGQLPRHYAPRTPLHLVGSPSEIPGAARADSALLLVDGSVLSRAGFLDGTPDAFTHVETLSPRGDSTEAAARLFAALRRLDSLGVREIYAVAVPERGLGRAIMDRLRRAAQPAG